MVIVIYKNKSREQMKLEFLKKYLFFRSPDHNKLGSNCIYVFILSLWAHGLVHGSVSGKTSWSIFFKLSQYPFIPTQMKIRPTKFIERNIKSFRRLSFKKQSCVLKNNSAAYTAFNEQQFQVCVWILILWEPYWRVFFTIYVREATYHLTVNNVTRYCLFS